MRRLTQWLPISRLCRRIGAVGTCLLLATGLALAHSPYLSLKAEWADWTSPDGTPYSLAVLWGDGILAANPLRPVVLSAREEVVAIGPLVTDAYIHCRTGTDCIVFLDLRHLEKDTPAAVVPDPSGFRFGRTPDFYPEHERTPYGFKATSLTLGEHWVAWTIPYRRNPLALPWTLLLIWLGLKGGGAPVPAWRAVQHLPALPLRVLGFAVAWAGRVLATALLPLVGVFFSLLEGSMLNLRPHLAAFLMAFVIGLGRALAHFIAPPREDRDQTGVGSAN